MQDVARCDSDGVQYFDKVSLPASRIQVADEVWLGELRVGIVEQDASHHEKECGDTDTESKRLGEVPLFMLHLGVDLQRHCVALECEAADAKEVGHSLQVEGLKGALKLRRLDLLYCANPYRGHCDE